MRNSFNMLVVIVLLALSALACSLGLNLPGGQIDAAATQAAAAVATAASAADTAVNQGADLLATAEAQATAIAQVTLVPPVIGDGSVSVPLGNLTTSDGTFVLTVTDAEFNQFLAQQAGGATEQLLRNPQVRFHDGIVTLTGEITQPLTASLTANFQPVVVDGQVRFAIRDATVGGFPAPQAVLELIQANVDTAVARAMTQLPASVVIQTVEISGNTLMATGLTN